MANTTTLPGFIVVSENDIAKRAYQLYTARGCANGFDREDWLRAERELRRGGPAAAPEKSRKAITTVGKAICPDVLQQQVAAEPQATASGASLEEPDKAPGS